MNVDKPTRPAGKQRIDSLQALRALAFLGIFLRHARCSVEWAMLGVSVVFVMSGFLMEYRYGQSDLKSSVKDNLLFSVRKVWGLYPLHILTMIVWIILQIRFTLPGAPWVASILGLRKEILLNVTLTQTWVPDSAVNVSLNGVAWYLSVTLFLYFTFPWLRRVVERFKLRWLCAACAVLLVAEVAACALLIKRLGADSPAYVWFMYCFPVFRLGDFFVGCALKRVYLESGIREAGTLKATAFELLATAATVLVSLWFNRPHAGVLPTALRNWTSVFIPLAALWVLLFAARRGLITRVLSNKALIWVGNLSAFAFLIHYPITQYADLLLPLVSVNVAALGRTALVVIELAASIMLSFLYKWIHGAIRSRRRPV